MRPLSNPSGFSVSRNRSPTTITIFLARELVVCFESKVMSNLHELRRVRRMAAPPLDIRATTKKAEFEYEQPTAVIALTSTFTPPSTCFENRLTMLPPASFIWHNEPVPVANNTVAACFPSEFLESYTSVNTTNAGGTTIGSSVVPAMSPFVCPKNYCTVFAEARNYIACCPS